MRFLTLLHGLAALLLAACTAQKASDQLLPRQTVQVCQGNACTTQASSTVTFQPPALEQAAVQQLHALQDMAQQDPRAAYDLGQRLLRGDGVSQDSHQGLQWLRQAAYAGLAPAQLALGRLYLSGLESMGSDPAEAHAWLQRAAMQGDREAQRLLPGAQAAIQDAHARYQLQEQARQSGEAWYFTAPYYWSWGPSGWHRP